MAEKKDQRLVALVNDERVAVTVTNYLIIKSTAMCTLLFVLNNSQRLNLTKIPE
jgi:hypothetical protein